MNLLKEEICISIYDLVLISIRDLKISTDKTVMSSAIKLFKILTVEKIFLMMKVIFKIAILLPLLNNHLKFNSRENDMENNLNCIQQNQYRPVCTKNFEMVALECFEKEDTDVSLLFETMLLTGLRTEEACGLKWNENGYVFLNTHKKPFVPETLPKLMRQFREKYNLEYMTAYGLRHSFATFCSEQGMEEIVLMRLMGNSNFDTTQKYYICISSKRKRQAIESVYKNIFEKESRNKKLVKNKKQVYQILEEYKSSKISVGAL